MSNSLPSGRTAENLTVLEYDPEWSARFAELGGRLRSALGAVALRIDHIGSTAVPGLAAKPIIRRPGFGRFIGAGRSLPLGIGGVRLRLANGQPGAHQALLP